MLCVRTQRYWHDGWLGNYHDNASTRLLYKLLYTSTGANCILNMEHKALRCSREQEMKH